MDTMKEVFLGFHGSSTSGAAWAIFWTIVLDLAAHWEDVVNKFQDGGLVRGVADCYAMGNPVNFIRYAWRPAVNCGNVFAESWASGDVHQVAFEVGGDGATCNVQQGSSVGKHGGQFPVDGGKDCHVVSLQKIGAQIVGPTIELGRHGQVLQGFVLILVTLHIVDVRRMSHVLEVPHDLVNDVPVWFQGSVGELDGMFQHSSKPIDEALGISVVFVGGKGF